MSGLLLDRAGRRRSPATMPGFHAGCPPRNKGLRYPADPLKVEKIIAVMHAAGDHVQGPHLRALIVILWRADAALLRSGRERCPTSREGASAPVRHMQSRGRSRARGFLFAHRRSTGRAVRCPPLPSPGTTATEYGTSSASLRMTGVDRPLGGESPFVCGPRFAAGNIGSQFRKLVEKARRSKPEQHRRHHEVARAERPIEPVGIAQAGRELDQSIANAVFDQRQALFGPWLVALREPGGHEFEDRRLHGAERGEHPGDGPRPRIGTNAGHEPRRAARPRHEP